MEILSFKEANEILEKASKIDNKNDKKILYVFAGPNGSGKSTLIANQYKGKKLYVEYVNADIYCNGIFGYVKNEDERNQKAMEYAMDKVLKNIDRGVAFCYETVLSHPSKIELIKKAKDYGFKIVSTFVYTYRPQINIKRVKIRAEQGGHDVPEDKIISRYYRSIKLAKELKAISDEFYKFDNSIDQNADCEPIKIL